MKINLFTVILLLAGPWLSIAADKPVAKPQVVRVRADGPALLLATNWAEKFGSSHPTQRVEIVSGKESPVLGLTRDRGSVALMARPLSTAELEEATKVFGEAPRSTNVAFLAEAVYLQLNNPLREMTLTQLQDIYAGRITNWQAVGNRSGPIRLYAHAPQPDYDDYFLRIVLHTNVPPPRAIIFSNSTQMLELLAKDLNGIGYAPRQPALSVKYLALKDAEKSPSAIPAIKTILQRRYPIVQPIKASLAPKCDNAAALDFFAWLNSEAAQSVAERSGYYRAPESKGEEAPASK